MYCIYKAQSKINGKIYIGKTNNFNKRRNEHLSDCRTGHQLFSRALHKYGDDAFEWSIIEHNIPTLEAANDREKFWIKHHNSYYKWENSNGYNMTVGGDGGSCWNIRRVAAYDTNGDMLQCFESLTECASHYGIAGTSDISRVCDRDNALCNGMMFKYYDDKPKTHIEPYQKPKSTKCVPIYQLDLNGRIIARYDSISDAEAKGFRHTGIIGCANKRYKQSEGYIWRYEEDLQSSIGMAVEPMQSYAGQYIKQYTVDGQFIKQYNSCAEAARQNNISSYKLIHKALNSETHFSCGFKWCKSV